MCDLFYEIMCVCKKLIIVVMIGLLMVGGMMLILNCDLWVGFKGIKVGIIEVKIGCGLFWVLLVLFMLL